MRVQKAVDAVLLPAGPIIMKSAFRTRSRARRPPPRPRYRCEVCTAAPVSIDPNVLASGHETVFEGPQIEGTGRRRCRNAQGEGRKDLLGVDARHKALAQEA